MKTLFTTFRLWENRSTSSEPLRKVMKDDPIPYSILSIGSIYLNKQHGGNQACIQRLSKCPTYHSKDYTII